MKESENKITYQNYIHDDANFDVLIFKESTERQKELTVENADLHKAALNKTMTIHKFCV